MKNSTIFSIAGAVGQHQPQQEQDGVLIELFIAATSCFIVIDITGV